MHFTLSTANTINPWLDIINASFFEICLLYSNIILHVILKKLNGLFSLVVFFQYDGLFSGVRNIEQV
jgi:hypothetical protein